MPSHESQPRGGATDDLHNPDTNDLAILENVIEGTPAWCWPDTSGSPPSARHGHSAAVRAGAAVEQVIVVGGRNETSNQCLGDVHVLDVEAWAWSQPAVEGQPPRLPDPNPDMIPHPDRLPPSEATVQPPCLVGLGSLR